MSNILDNIILLAQFNVIFFSQILSNESRLISFDYLKIVIKIINNVENIAGTIYITRQYPSSY